MILFPSKDKFLLLQEDINKKLPLLSKADPAPAHQTRVPLFEIFKGLIFENFDTHKLYCNQHAMFTICTLFSTLTYI